jgi:hypothetical protein
MREWQPPSLAGPIFSVQGKNMAATSQPNACVAFCVTSQHCYCQQARRSSYACTPRAPSKRPQPCANRHHGVFAAICRHHASLTVTATQRPHVSPCHCPRPRPRTLRGGRGSCSARVDAACACAWWRARHRLPCVHASAPALGGAHARLNPTPQHFAKEAPCGLHATKVRRSRPWKERHLPSPHGALLGHGCSAPRDHCYSRALAAGRSALHRFQAVP